MAAFGLPGGAEWLIIIGVIALLFIPGIIVFGLGFFAGKRAGERSSQLRAEDVSEADRDTMDELTRPVDEPAEDATDAEGDS
jgi:hypothetical protein